MTTKKKTAAKKWIPALRETLGSTRVLTSTAALREHGGDAWHAHAMPDAVVVPRNTEEISKTLRFAHKRHIPLTSRGAGKGYVGGCVPLHGGISLSLRRLDKILEISKPDSLAVVQAGVITGDLYRAAKQKGLLYPPDPASLNESSIGGNIATNAGGPRCLKYGVTKNYVLGLTAVLPGGDVVRLGGRTHKNKLGFNLTDLFIGSEGMLGVITEAILRLIPFPPSRAVLAASFPTAHQAAKTLQKIQHSGFLPSTLEIADAFTLQAARKYTRNVPPGDSILLIEVDGQPRSVKSEILELQKVAQSCGAVSTRIASTEKACDRLWEIRRGFSYSLRATGLKKMNHDIVVPRGRLLDVFRLARRIQKTYRVPVASFGHAGDGNIHVNIMIPEGREADPQIDRAVDDLLHSVIGLGGVITGEHGTGLARKPWWKASTTAELRALHHSIKKALDPGSILNPGKFLDP